MDIKTEKITKDSAFLRFLYNTAFGRILLKPLASRTVSKLAGAFLDMRMSKFLISGFIKRNNFTSDEYQLDGFRCFNDCFARRLKDGARAFDMTPEAFCSPCDGRLSVYKVTDGLVMPIKQSEYTVEALLCNKELAERYKNGLCLVFRLCVENYHRYSFIDSGSKDGQVVIHGKLHTVRPVALRARKVFCENSREYTVMHTDNFGDVTQVEVGAMLVGKIKNHDSLTHMERSMEKGTFLYGGSTIVLLVEEGRITLPDELFEATANEEEVLVKMGMKLGEKAVV